MAGETPEPKTKSVPEPTHIIVTDRGGVDDDFPEGSAEEIAQHIATEADTTVVVTPLDKVGNRIIDDQETFTPESK